MTMAKKTSPQYTWKSLLKYPRQILARSGPHSDQSFVLPLQPGVSQPQRVGQTSCGQLGRVQGIVLCPKPTPHTQIKELRLFSWQDLSLAVVLCIRQDQS